MPRECDGRVTCLTAGPFKRVKDEEEGFVGTMGRAWATMVAVMMTLDNHSVSEQQYQFWCHQPCRLRCACPTCSIIHSTYLVTSQGCEGRPNPLWSYNPCGHIRDAAGGGRSRSAASLPWQQGPNTLEAEGRAGSSVPGAGVARHPILGAQTQGRAGARGAGGTAGPDTHGPYVSALLTPLLDANCAMFQACKRGWCVPLWMPTARCPTSWYACPCYHNALYFDKHCTGAGRPGGGSNSSQGCGCAGTVEA